LKEGKSENLTLKEGKSENLTLKEGKTPPCRKGSNTPCRKARLHLEGREVIIHLLGRE